MKDRRKAIGLSQTALAARAGVGRQWLVAVEQGKPGAELALIFRVLDALDMPLMTGMPKTDETPKSVIDLDAIIAASTEDRP
ncbi:MAG: transcriptional regulator [Phenylobacterium zucineum]|nr:MAG: transcriptional regulator [Phenylobacterium zucineum]